jgi:ribonuclease T1
MRLSFAFGRFVAAITLVSLTGAASFAQPRAVQEVLPAIEVADLPREARETLGLIRAGGPFPYERDGVRFGNRQRLLPPKARGYYREYTVRTPGTRNRGARRIVCGGPARTPDACYYTDDHYRSFSRVRE